MAITITPLTPPTIYVNGTHLRVKEVQMRRMKWEGHRHSSSDKDSIPKFVGPVTITFKAPAGSTVRYTFNSKKVNLSSKQFRANTPIVVRSGGNGFGDGILTIRAKAYKHGEASATAEAVCLIEVGPTGVGAKSEAYGTGAAAAKTFRGEDHTYSNGEKLKYRS